MTLLELVCLCAQLEQTPLLLGGVTGWLRPVGAKASVTAARKEAPAAHAWSHQPLRSLMPVRATRILNTLGSV